MLSFAGEVQPWPMSSGSYGNYLLVQGEGVNYADDLADARLLWKSECETSPASCE